MEDIVYILNCCKKKGETGELVTQFNNGVQLWVTVDDAYLDGILAVETYIKSNKLMGTVF
jgi:hypothetical protein